MRKLLIFFVFAFLCQSWGDPIVAQADVASISPTGADQTTDLNNYFDSLASNGDRYANFDKAGEYLASGDLKNAYKVILNGNAKINKANPDNVYVNIINSLNSFNGKINSESVQAANTSIDAGSFKQVVKAIAQNRTVKVAFIGDSITASSPDTSNFNTRVAETTTNGYRASSSNGIVPDNSYVYQIMNKLADQFPSTTFSMNNYAVGGTRIDLWNTTQNYWGTSKVWIDWLKEAKPDLVFIAFGMNNNNFDNAKIFAYNLKSMIDYIHTNFDSTPDIVVVTTPRPIYVPGHVDWGNYENQGGREVAQNAARAIAKEYGAYVMDVGRLSDIKRIGLDYTKPIMKRISLTDFDVSTVGATRNGDDSFDFTPIGAGSIYLKGNYQKDFTVKLNMIFNTPTADINNSLIFNFNKVRDGNFYDNRVRILPKNTGTNLAKIQSIARVADFANWGSSGITKEWNDDRVYDKTPVTVIISKRAEKLEVRIVRDYNAEFVAIQDYVDVLDVHGFFEIRYEQSGKGNTARLNSIEINGAEYPKYLPAITENEMFGGFVEGDYSTKLPYGGSGTNHPSSIGVEEVYTPCVDELVDDIAARVRNG